MVTVKPAFAPLIASLCPLRWENKRRTDLASRSGDEAVAHYSGGASCIAPVSPSDRAERCLRVLTLIDVSPYCQEISPLIQKLTVFAVLATIPARIVFDN